MAALVTLAINTDYLKRIKEIAPNVNQGITTGELASASASAEGDILTALVALGFDISLVTSGDPPLVTEMIKMLASARVWAMMRKEYTNDLAFENTQEFELLEMVNRAMAGVASTKILIRADRSVMKASSVAQGKGVPKFLKTDQFVTDDNLQSFIDQHGPRPGSIP